MIQRLNLNKAEEGLQFIIDTQKKIRDSDTDELLVVGKFKHELSNLHLL